MTRLVPAILITVLLVSCAKSEISTSGDGTDDNGKQDETETFITVEPASFTASSDGTVQTVTIKSSGTWELSESPDWCIPSLSAGENETQIAVEVLANPEPYERDAFMVFGCGEKSAELHIIQKQTDALTVTTSRFEVGADGGLVEVEVIANIDFTYEVPEEYSSWISPVWTKSLQSHTLRFEIAPNEDTGRREGQLTISSGEISETVHIYQSGTDPVLVLTQDEYIVPDTGGTIKVEIASNTEYTASMPNVDWIKEAGTKAVSTRTRYYSISPNETYDHRYAQIVFTTVDGSLRQTVYIAQVQKNAIIIDKAEYEVGDEGGEIAITLRHNISCSVYTPDWIHYIPETKGLTTTVARFTVDPNPGYDGRTGTITFTDGTIEQSVTVIQGQCDVLLLPQKEFSVGADGGNVDVRVRANTPYRFIISDASYWVDYVTPTRAVTEETLTFSLSKNTTYGERTAEIYFMSEDRVLKDTVRIVQAQNDEIIVNTDECRIGNAGGTFTVEVSHNVGYEVSTPDWIHLQPGTRALETSVLSFLADANDIGSERIGYIDLIAQGIERSIKVVQEAGIVEAILKLSANEASFSIYGGSTKLTVEANVGYTVEMQEEDRAWVSYSSSITSPSITSYTFYISRNDTYSPRKAEIVFASTDGTLRETFVITQEQIDMIALDPARIETGYAAGKISTSVTANVEYTITVNQSAASWITVLDTGVPSSLVLSVTENHGFKSRSGYVTLESVSGSEEATLIVKQTGRPVELSVSEASVTMPSSRSETTVNIETNSTYWRASSDKSWCRVTPTSGTASGTVTIRTSSDNTTGEPRTATVTIRATVNGDDGQIYATKTITVVQDAASLSLSKDYVESGDKGEVFSIDVNCNSVWTAASDAGWCTVSPASGNGNGSLSITVSRNDTDAERRAVVTVTTGTGVDAISKTVTVKQYPEPSLILSQDHIESGDKGEVFSIDVNCNSVWTAASDTSWCTVSSASGNGNGSLFITISRNDTDAERRAVVTVTTGTGVDAISKIVSVKQFPPNNFDIGDWEPGDGDHGGNAE